MKHAIISIIIFVFSFLTISTVFTQDLIIYPAKGQRPEMIEKDKYDFYSWAKREIGVDPVAAIADNQGHPLLCINGDKS